MRSLPFESVGSTTRPVVPFAALTLGHLGPATIRKIAYGNATALYRCTAPPVAWLERSVVGAPLS